MKTKKLRLNLRRTRMLYIIAAVGIAFCIVLAYSFIEPYLFQTKTTVLKSEKITDKISGLKIVFISDIHQGKIMPLSRVADIVNRVNKENPDIILLGGDYITWNCDIEGCFRELKRLKAKYGIFGVLGNHEHKTGLAKRTEELMGESGIKKIDNEAVIADILGDKIAIGGVGDLLYDRQNINPLIEIDSSIFKILVSHNPDYVDNLKEEKLTDSVELVVSGDTHGGQVTFFGLWIPFLRSESAKEHPGGEYDIGKMKLIVSNGVGVLGVPLRLWAPPQINVIILEKM